MRPVFHVPTLWTRDPVKKIIMDRKRSEEAVFSTDFSRARPNSPGSIYETNGAVQRRARGPVDELE